MLRSSLEQSIEQLEEELRNYGGTPLSVPGGRDDSSVPRLFVPEIAIPVSEPSSLIVDMCNVRFFHCRV